MIPLVAAYLGGLLTIFSPCILPVLPFVLARADQPFFKARLPMLAGLALAFAVVATLSVAGGDWVIRANEYGRYAALAALALFGWALLSPAVAERLARPAVALGNRLFDSAQSRGTAATVGGSLLLGMATGLLWAPCAGPILGLVLTGAALHGAGAGTVALLTAYAAGAATSLGLGLLAGGRVLHALKRTTGTAEWVRRGLGAVVLCAVAGVALGADRGALSRFSSPATDRLETALLDVLHVNPPSGKNMNPDPHATPAAAGAYRSRLPVEGRLPGFDGAVTWLNSAPLTPAQLQGKAVLVDFWTYSCINCIRTLPYVRAWANKYRDQGLVVIGVHTPEFAFEKNVDNIKKALGEFKLDFPIAVDSNFGIWRAFDNSYWPAFYLADAQGRIRYHHFGEGEYETSEKAIQDLLREAGGNAQGALAQVEAPGVQAAPDLRHVRSGETYLGFKEAANFASPEGLAPNAAREYTGAPPRLNQWSLAGAWTVGAEQATLARAGGAITYRFSARDLHLVLGPGAGGKPVRFQVLVDGRAPEADHGADIDAEGNGSVTRTRLYQLVRQGGAVKERTFEVRFLDPGVQAYVFTFG
ncbi:MAG TPA: cytochrome c biogenesis protein DipZ [Burkholderiales bacterium]